MNDLQAFDIWLKDKLKPSTHRNYIYVLKKWFQFLNGRNLTKEIVQEYIAHLESRGIVDSTIYSTILTCINKYYVWKDIKFDSAYIPGRRYMNDYIKKYREEHPEYREYCRNWLRINMACIKIDGKLVWVRVHRRSRPETCELCHRDSCRLNYHHWDNNCPSKGIWLCFRCHRLAEAVDVDKDSPNKYLKLKKQIEDNFRL